MADTYKPGNTDSQDRRSPMHAEEWRQGQSHRWYQVRPCDHWEEHNRQRMHLGIRSRRYRPGCGQAHPGRRFEGADLSQKKTLT